VENVPSVPAFLGSAYAQHCARSENLETPLKLPEKTILTITSDGKPIAGVPVKLVFLMLKKNHHVFVFGPSDMSGTVSISNDEIRREARKTMELFLMDYADIEAHWTGRLRVMPLNREGIKAALSAYSTFGSNEFPPNYEQMLLAADAILSKIPKATLEVSVRFEPDQRYTVETVSVRAEENTNTVSDGRPN
jgi:hypothetical protein